MTTENLPLYGMPGHLIRRCHQIAVALFMRECDAFEITPIQFAVLTVLEACPGKDQAGIAGRVAIDRSTIGKVVLRLEERGLLSRNADKNDRRVKRLNLTDKGLDLLAEIGPAVERAQQSTIAPLDEAEQAVLIYLLQKIAETNNEFSRVPLNAGSGRK